MADVKWIKITTDMFDNRKIKHLRKLPAGNDIVLIWVMLLTMAGRCNSGGMIYLTENIPYTTKMLADELGFEESVITIALNALEELNMITRDSSFLTIPGWEEYQSIDKLEKIREQNRIRKQRQREKDRQLMDCHVTVTQSHATDKEEDKDKEQKKNKKEKFFPPDLEEPFKKTFEAYPKKTGYAMAKQAWLDKLVDVVEENRIDVARLIYKATVAYINDYKHSRPEDEDFRYIPQYSNWIANECDYWLGVVEKRIEK